MWPYVIAGSCMIVFSVPLLVFSPLNIDEKMMSSMISGVKNAGEHIEEQLKNVFWILLAVAVFYISFTSQQRVFDGYIYSMALCSLSFTVSFYKVRISIRKLVKNFIIKHNFFSSLLN